MKTSRTKKTNLYLALIIKSLSLEIHDRIHESFVFYILLKLVLCRNEKFFEVEAFVSFMVDEFHCLGDFEFTLEDQVELFEGVALFDKDLTFAVSLFLEVILVLFKTYTGYLLQEGNSLNSLNLLIHHSPMTVLKHFKCFPIEKSQMCIL